MEERLDDALNVLRNHCEPQLAIPNMDGSPFVSSPAGHTQDNEPPTAVVKLERSSNSSKLIKNHFFYSLLN